MVEVTSTLAADLIAAVHAHGYEAGYQLHPATPNPFAPTDVTSDRGRARQMLADTWRSGYSAGLDALVRARGNL